MKKIMGIIICTSMAIVLNWGCVARYSLPTTSTPPIRTENISKLVKGKSTKADVIELFGAPLKANMIGADEMFLYERCFSTGKTGFMHLFHSGAYTCEQLTILFDGKTDIVKSFSFQK